MKLTMTRVLTPLAALAFTLGAQATDFAKDDFEGQWSNSTGGYSFTAGPDQAADASAQYTYDGDAPAAALSPIGGATNLKGLKLSTEDGILFRNLTDAGVGASGLYVDTDVQFTITDAADRPTPVTEGNDTDKFIIWLEADDAGNTNLCVWAREYKLDNGAIAANSNKVYKLNASAIAPGSWHRLTVKAIAQINAAEAATKIPGFQVYLDSTLLSSSDAMFPSDDYTACWNLLPEAAQGLADAGTFFPAMSDTLTSLAKVGFSGEGKIDDFVVSDDIPSALPRVALTVTWDDSVISNVTFVANGGTKTLTSSGSLLTLEPSTSATFTMANIDPVPGVDLSSYSFKAIETGDWAANNVILGIAGDPATVTATVGDQSGNGAFTIALDRNTAAVATIRLPQQIASITKVTYTIDNGTPVEITAETEDPEEEQPYFEEGEIKVPIEIEQTLTITVTTASGYAATVTAEAGATGSAPTFEITANTATFQITTAAAQATVNGVAYPTFAAALAAAKAASPATITLNSAVTLDAAAAIAAGDDITIDLAGQTLTGAADEAVFSNAGTLTITNSTVAVGTVVAGADGSAVANTGTLNLQAGKFAGAIAGGTIYVSGGSYSAAIAGATCTPGYELASVGLDANYPYELSLASYTITYMYEGNELPGITPTTYTVEDTVSLTNEVDLGVVGVSFQAWTNAEGTVVAGWSAGDKTGAQTFYAQVTAVVPPSGETIEPGAQSTTTYSSQADAEAAAANVTIAASDAVTNALDSAAQATYLAKFEAKVVEAGEGSYKIEIGLKAAAEAELEAVADAAVATAASSLAAAASADQTVEVDAEPGFYYSVASGTEVGSLTEGARTLATGSKVNLTLPTQGTKGFYRVLINVTPSAQN